MRYWLLKSEPDTFGIDHLARALGKTTGWDGVRNFQARNFLRKMAQGDQAFFYHSSCAIPGIAGTVTIARKAYPDASAFDRKDPHFDAKSDRERPTWFAVEVKLEERFDDVLSLETLRRHENRELQDLVILRKGNRLSVTPVTKNEWDFIHSLRPSLRKASGKTQPAVRTRRKSVKK